MTMSEVVEPLKLGVKENSALRQIISDLFGPSSLASLLLQPSGNRQLDVDLISSKLSSKLADVETSCCPDAPLPSKFQARFLEEVQIVTRENVDLRSKLLTRMSPSQLSAALPPPWGTAASTSTQDSSKQSPSPPKAFPPSPPVSPSSHPSPTSTSSPPAQAPPPLHSVQVRADPKPEEMPKSPSMVCMETSEAYWHDASGLEVVSNENFSLRTLLLQSMSLEKLLALLPSPWGSREDRTASPTFGSHQPAALSEEELTKARLAAKLRFVFRDDPASSTFSETSLPLETADFVFPDTPLFGPKEACSSDDLSVMAQLQRTMEEFDCMVPLSRLRQNLVAADKMEEIDMPILQTENPVAFHVAQAQQHLRTTQNKVVALYKKLDYEKASFRNNTDIISQLESHVMNRKRVQLDAEQLFHKTKLHIKIWLVELELKLHEARDQNDETLEVRRKEAMTMKIKNTEMTVGQRKRTLTEIHEQYTQMKNNIEAKIKSYQVKTEQELDCVTKMEEGLEQTLMEKNHKISDLSEVLKKTLQLNPDRFISSKIDEFMDQDQAIKIMQRRLAESQEENLVLRIDFIKLKNTAPV